MTLLRSLHARFDNLLRFVRRLPAPALAALAVFGAAGGYAAHAYAADDCCHPGAACCHPGAACCARHHKAQS